MDYKEYKKSVAQRLGVSTACFYPDDMADTFKMIAELYDVRRCEIFINTESETRIKTLRPIRELAADKGIKITSVHPYFSGYESMLFFSDYKKRTLDSVKLYRQFFEAAAYLGADYVIMHGARSEGKGVDFAKFYAENFCLLNDEAQKYGVEVLQENVHTHLAVEPEFIAALKTEGAKIGRCINFTFDAKHSLCSGIAPLRTLEAMGANVCHVHLNDMVANREVVGKAKVELCRLPTFGDTDYDAILRKLFDVNYIGDFVIEVYRKNFGAPAQIADAIARFRGWLYE